MNKNVCASKKVCSTNIALTETYGGGASTELTTRGVCVTHQSCEKHIFAAGLAFVLKSIDRMLLLPGPMSSSPPMRHFLPFATTRGYTEEKEAEHRNDFLLPISPSIEAVLRVTLKNKVGDILVDTLGKDAEMAEMTAITSEPHPNATPQAVHSDSEWHGEDTENKVQLVTVFVALHDILDESMGPTQFWPNTHAPHCFIDGKWIAPTPVIAKETPHTWYPLNAGDSVVMNPCLWHCGGANTSNMRRTLLSFSFTKSKPVEENDSSASDDIKKWRLCDFL